MFSSSTKTIFTKNFEKVADKASKKVDEAFKHADKAFEAAAEALAATFGDSSTSIQTEHMNVKVKDKTVIINGDVTQIMLNGNPLFKQ